jgi:oligopeptide/dipeptide ABC transporter ATP-binding protein
VTEPLLSVRDLRIGFPTAQGMAVAVDGISFDVAAGETLGIVGESGCGKSVTALSILRLAGASARLLGGSIRFQGREITTLSKQDLGELRGAEIGMIFQEPMTSLNPVFTVGEQIGESLRRHLGLSRRAAFARAVELLDLVGIPDPRRRAQGYPHEMSGGMRQRVMIALALACRPKLLLADEPTTALDVTIQAQILELLAKLQKDLGTAIVLITHDLGVVAEFTRRVLVMYAGRIVEQASVEDLFARPLHPYAEGLLASIPPADADVDRLASIPGSVPPLLALPPGCRFAPRCTYARDACARTDPRLIAFGPRAAACIRHTGYAPAAAAA